MDRTRIEGLATSLTVGLTCALFIVAVLGIADGVLDWDLLPDGLDRVAVVLAWSLGVGLLASGIVSLALNLSRMATALEGLSRNGPTR